MHRSEDEEITAMADEMQSLQKDLQELRDMEEIRRLKALYTRAVDAHDWDTYASLVTDDFHMHGDGGPLEGRDSVVASVSSALADASTVHHVYAPVIDFTGPDTASVIWRMEDWVRMTYQGKAMAFHGHGFYHEDYVRTDDGWRLKKCVTERIRVDPIESPPASSDEKE